MRAFVVPWIFSFAMVLMSQSLAAQEQATPMEGKMETMQTGKFEPTWESLAQYEVPEWFRDAKFGIWAHWGPQCQPEAGDWYARHMYVEGHGQYKHHLQHFGHPSKVGFKDVIHQWKAENWDPDKLVALYKRAGAKYFFAMANHHDNLDMWDSPHQPWNSIAVGPKKNIVAGWAKAAKENGLRFGLSVHSAHAWTWYETAQSADKTGEFAGIPYDGKLTKADGKGQWWDGLDPQDLYAQNHSLSQKSEDSRTIHSQWDWGGGASIPDAAYCGNFYNRNIDLINKYQPDLVYYDDTALPLWPISDVGLKIAAHYYNSSMQLNGGKLDCVLFGKVLDEKQRECLVWDIERGAPNRIEPIPWQTCTCIGGWHYDRGVYDRKAYKGTKTVVHMLADIVSKNGNLLLNIPVRGDGTIDEQEVAIVEGIGKWLDVNGEAIFGTRPWKTFGEGPASDGAPISAQGFNEGKGKPFTANDLRFTVKDDALYVIVLGIPTERISIKSFSQSAKLLDRSIEEITLVGSDEKVEWSHGNDALTIQPPGKMPCENSIVYKVKLSQ